MTSLLVGRVHAADPTDVPRILEEKKVGNIAVAARPSSFFDEKDSIDKEAPSSSEIGEVYAEGPRLIDLGEDGKERPIGKMVSTQNS